MIEDIAVWSLYPDWSDGMTETLEFLTTVAASPLAFEQRRGLRLSPRQYIEYSYILNGPTRTYFDLLTMRSAGSPVYVPLWHDVELLPFAHNAGAIMLAVDTLYTEFHNTTYAMIGGPFDYEVVEIVSINDAAIGLAEPLQNSWKKGTRIVPLKKCKLDQQPSTTRRSSMVHVARVKFCSLVPNKTKALPPLRSLGRQFILEEDPNEVEDLTYAYERVMTTLDNTMGKVHLTDVTGQVMQQFSWYGKGRAEADRLRGLFYQLDGRRVPLWVPTVYSDFQLTLPIFAGGGVLTVKRCGYTDTGGPTPQREFILIHLRDGSRWYNKIVDSEIVGDGAQERLFLEFAPGFNAEIEKVRRISFLVLCRLDTDTIELLHHTATRGMTTCKAIFRSAAAMDGIEDYEIEPDDSPAPVCVSDFQWFSVSPWVVNEYAATRLDQFGNYYETPRQADRLNIYSPGGALLNTITEFQFVDMINGWYGSPIVIADASYNQVYSYPIRQGKYVLSWLRSARVGWAFDQWWILTEPNGAGSLTIRGAYFMRNLTGPPYIYGLTVPEIYNDDDALLFAGYLGIGSRTAALGVLPSINQYLDNTYGAGFGATGYLPQQVPTAILYPIGNRMDLTTNLYMTMPTNGSQQYALTLPGNDRTVMYIYFNRMYLDYIATSTSGFVPLEVRNVIQPAFPLGVMLKIPLGDLDYETIADTTYGTSPLYKGRATDDYEIDNHNWQDENGGVAIPFLDEYTYISDDSVGGADVYSAQISAQLRTNGRFWIIFVMAGVNDAIHRGTGLLGDYAYPVYARVRVFDYNPATEIATQVFTHTCVLHDVGNMPPPTEENGFWVLSNDLNLIAEIIESGDTGTVMLHGQVFKMALCRFHIAED